ncbi:MAG: cysteine--tRNA ligase [Hyphomicrobiales bacterium]|nr:cysteine--tRNA ligase [Hyphomicrobiales bacterium]
MTLKLYNTLTRQKQNFVPIDAANVRMYVCGPTVYDYAHIGNARPVIIFDVLYRLLRHIYGASAVKYVRNITDVDDKINARAAEEHPDLPLNEAIAKVTSETTQQFHEDIAALGVLPPDVEPTCTGHIPQMIDMIKVLIDKGNAYAAEGHVLLDVGSIASYGELSRRSLDEMIAGARVEVAPYKKNPADSVLWKPSTDEQPGWDSPWGRGRPGWHIECSAMAKQHLGEVFDIHGGGIDLVFPHHENEVAQSRSAHGTSTMANIWMHNGFLQVEGAKMSKSEGNFLTIHGLLQQWPGEVLRFNMLRTQYRQPIDWTERGLEESSDTLRNWTRDVNVAETTPAFAEPVIEALGDDLNTPLAIARIHELDPVERAATLNALGFAGNLADPREATVDAGAIGNLIAARSAARADKNWAESDRIRDELGDMGIQLKDAKNPDTGEIETTWEVKR